MISFFAVLDKLFSFLQVYLKKKEEAKWQKEQDDVEASPADWFDSHFDGMPTMPSDDKAEQANPENK
jgi:hypothetical protein